MKIKLTKRLGRWGEIWEQFLRNRMAVVGLVILVLLVLCALFAPQIAPQGYDEQNPAIALQPPSSSHWFGTDNFGRDILSRILYGGRISLQVGLIAVAIAMISGSILGATAAFYGGRLDTLIMRFTDMLMAIPGMLLAITIAAALGPSLRNVMIAVGLSTMPSYIRVVRASVLMVKDNEYIESAKAIGADNLRIIWRHIAPNALAPVMVQATLGVASAILSCATLSFLGLGIQPPQPEWGAMLSGARQYLRGSGYMAIFPGLFIMLTVFAFNVIGDGLRDAMDPRLKN